MNKEQLIFQKGTSKET